MESGLEKAKAFFSRFVGLPAPRHHHVAVDDSKRPKPQTHRVTLQNGRMVPQQAAKKAQSLASVRPVVGSFVGLAAAIGSIAFVNASLDTPLAKAFHLLKNGNFTKRDIEDRLNQRLHAMRRQTVEHLSTK